MVGALLICAAEKEDGWKMEKQKQKENKEKGREGERKHVRESRHRSSAIIWPGGGMRT